MSATPLRISAAALAAAGLLSAATVAGGVVQTIDDGQGRTITFDVQASGVDLAGYATILRDALHRDEIESVTVRIVPQSAIPSSCSPGASACYRIAGGQGTITVPASAPEAVRHTLLHEYGHHVDFSIATPQATGRGGDGTPGWWNGRGIGGLLSQGQVAYDYSLGWSRSIAEIYAEDYVQAHGSERFGISWLPRPTEGVLGSLRRDITGDPSPPLPTPPEIPPPSLAPDPGPPLETGPPAARPGPGKRGAAGGRGRAGRVVVGRATRSRGRLTRRYAGWIRPGRSISIPVQLPRRRSLGFRARLDGIGAPASVGAALVCRGRRLAAARGRETRDAIFHKRSLLRGRCRVVLRNVGSARVRFQVRISTFRP